MKPGTRFGKYVILERIAYGGMAEVFKAKAVGEAGFERLVAIKKLHKEYSSDPEIVAMLLDEARLCSKLVHRNIGQVFDLGRVGDSYYIAMEYIDGRDLADIMRRARRVFPRTLPYPAVYYIMREVLDGLDYAHTKRDEHGRPLGIIHRDVSPQNVLVSFEGEVKLIDFGVAKARIQSHRTEAGVIKGKFRYMSPEQARGEPIDHRSDIFAAGILFYELMLGRPHSRGLTDMQVLLRLQRGELEPLDQLVPDVPAAVNAIIEKALAPNPAHRFQSAGEFRRELDAYCRSAGLDFDRQAMAEIMRQLFPDAHAPPVPLEAPGRATLAELDELSGGTVELGLEDLEFEGAGPSEVAATERIRTPGALHAPELARMAASGPPQEPVRPDGAPRAGGPGADGDLEVPVTVADTPSSMGLGQGRPQGDSPHRAQSTTEARGGRTGGRIPESLKKVASGLAGLAILAGLLAGAYFGYRALQRSRAHRERVVHVGGQAKRVRATFSISSVPKGAWILVDGKHIGRRTPAKFTVEAADEVELELRLDGYETWKKRVPVGSGEVIQLEARLLRQGRGHGRQARRSHVGRREKAGRTRAARTGAAAVSSSPAGGRASAARPVEEEEGLPGRLEINCNKRAWVYVNGRRYDYTPTSVEVPPGHYTVYVARGRQRSKAQYVRVRPGDRQILHFTLP